MLQFSKIISLLLLILLFSCKLESGSDESTSIISSESDGDPTQAQSPDNTEISFNFLRVNPYLQQRVDSRSRAFAISNLVKYTVKQGDNIVREGEFSDRHFEFEEGTYNITLNLPIGDGYIMYIESYNLKISSIVPTVKGQSTEFSISDGVITPIEITLLPTAPKSLNLGVQEVIEDPIHSVYSFVGYEWEYGGEYWYEIEATSSFTEINRNIIDNFIASCEVLVFDENGLYIISQMDTFGSISFKSEANKKYYFVIIPMDYRYYAEDYKAETISFIVDNYLDENNSKESARETRNNSVEDIFVGANDIDYQKIYLEPGQYSLDVQLMYPSEYQGMSGSNNDLTVEVYSSSDLLLGTTGKATDDVLEVDTTGYYYFKVISLSSDIATFEEYDLSINPINIATTNTVTNSWIEHSIVDASEEYYFKYTIDPLKDYTLEINNNSQENYISPYLDLYNYIDNNAGGLDRLYRVCNLWEQDKVHYVFPDFNSPVLLLKADYYETGSFAIKFEEIVPTYIPVASDIETISLYSDGALKYYSYEVSEGDTVRFQSTGFGEFYIYDSDKNYYYLKADEYNGLDQEFVIDSGVTTLFIKVLHTYPGDIDFTIGKLP